MSLSLFLSDELTHCVEVIWVPAQFAQCLCFSKSSGHVQIYEESRVLDSSEKLQGSGIFCMWRSGGRVYALPHAKTILMQDARFQCLLKKCLLEWLYDPSPSASPVWAGGAQSRRAVNSKLAHFAIDINTKLLSPLHTGWSLFRREVSLSYIQFWPWNCISLVWYCVWVAWWCNV